MFHSGNDLLHFSSQELWSEQGYSFSQKKTTNSLLPLSPLGKHSVMPTFHLPPRVGQRHGREDRQWERGRKNPLKRKSQCPAVPRTPAKVPRVTRTSTTKSVRTWCLGPEGLGTSGALAPQPCGPPALAHSPQDVVDTHDALRLQVAGVVDDRPLRLQPHVAPVLRKHPVLAADHLPFGAH